MKKDIKLGIEKLETKMYNYMGPLPKPWKGPLQVRGSEAYGLLVVHVCVFKDLLVRIPL
jgi:hypothetical protein